MKGLKEYRAAIINLFQQGNSGRKKKLHKNSFLSSNKKWDNNFQTPGTRKEFTLTMCDTVEGRRLRFLTVDSEKPPNPMFPKPSPLDFTEELSLNPVL